MAMQHSWNIRSRAHFCARTGRPFVEGETFHTAIYFDTAVGEFMRRDVCLDAWEEEQRGSVPFSSWKSLYAPPDQAKAEPDITGRESPEELLRRMSEEDEERTEKARYILALMLERKKLLVPKEVRPSEQGTMLIYEHRKTGEVFILRDPELRLDEIEAVQEEVSALLGFGGAAVAEGTSLTSMAGAGNRAASAASTRR